MTSTLKREEVIHRAADAVPVDDDWLKVSTDGFAEQNVARKPGHIVKELVQNAFDAIGTNKGSVYLDFSHGAPIASGNSGEILVECRDDGGGIMDLNNIRTVFWTSKQDSVLNRGRMGRGFKEALCLATACRVHSGSKGLHFTTENGKRKLYDINLKKTISGTEIAMTMPWGKEVIEELETYFATFLPPDNIDFFVNGSRIKHREPKHVIDCTLTTEKWEKGRWVKPQSKTKIHLIRTRKGEEPLIYEMGIPVTSAEWERPYHMDIQQRVPQNPNRDAVATGYAEKLHKAALPVVKDEMEQEALTKEWVSKVLPDMPLEVKQDVIRRGFGAGAVRSVPTMGDRRDFDAEAEEKGHPIVRTQHLPAGFREVFNEIIPSSKDAVEESEDKELQAAAQAAFDPVTAFKKATQDAKKQQELINKIGGLERVKTISEFAGWFVNQLLNPDGDKCTAVTVGLLKDAGRVVHATWSSRNVYTLAIDYTPNWQTPFAEDQLTTHIHEAAHNRAMHHGKAFHEEVERLSGRAAKVMLENSDHIKKTFKTIMT